MPNDVTARLEFSRDPLSDLTPTYIDVTAYLVECDWWAGVDNEGDDPTTGGAWFRLKNTDRRFEPDYVAGAYYPDIDTERRWRLSLDSGSGFVQEGVWYATHYAIEYPARDDYSEVIVTCVDGWGLLSLDNLESLDPPDAASYEAVVNYDEPSFYYRLGEPEGTKLVSHVKTKKTKTKKGKRHKTTTRWQTVETAAEVGGVSGPPGTYKNTPTLGQPGAILGDQDTSVLFTRASSEYAIVAVDQSDAIDTNRLTLEGWAKATTWGGHIVAGPNNTAVGTSVFELLVDGAGTAKAVLQFTDVTSGTVNYSGSPIPLDEWHHYAATWDGSSLRFFWDGEEAGSANYAGKVLRQGSANGALYVGAFFDTAAPAQFWDGWLDEVTVYEKALTPDRIRAHYIAGAERGFPEMLAGERIAEIATHDLWSEAKIQTGSFNVQPSMKAGQSKQGEIIEAMRAEGPFTLFYFDTAGDPVYLGWDYKSTAPYSEPQVTLGDDGSEVPYLAIVLDFDNEVYNEVQGSRDGGDGFTATDAASILARRRRVRTDEIGLSLSDDADLALILDEVLRVYSAPALRPTSVTVSGAHASALAHIQDRELGDLIRVKRRGEGGTPIDRVATIIGKRKHLDVSESLTCEWSLSRGSNSGGGWLLGITGLSELDSTTQLAVI